MVERPPLYFIRHGETDWNRDRRIQGRTDIALNETGRDQARRIAVTLKTIVPCLEGFRLFASPLARARETMTAITTAFGLGDDPVASDERLQEISFGEAEGKSWAEINAAGIDPAMAPDDYHDWRPSGGESYADATARVAAFLDELDAPAVVVSHGGISRVVRGIAFGLAKRDIVVLPVPQDRFFRIADGGLDWFDAR